MFLHDSFFSKRELIETKFLIYEMKRKEKKKIANSLLHLNS